MAQSINLIPQQEQQEQVKVKLVKSSTIVAIFVLVAVAGVSLFYFYKNKTLNDTLAASETQVASYRTDITKLVSTEIVARNLYTKSTTLKNIFDTRPAYSILLKEFIKRVPASIVIDNFVLNANGTFSISGSADDYNSIAAFINGLTDKTFSGAAAGYEGLFTTVSLNSVNLESKSNRANYFINVTYDGTKITSAGAGSSVK